MTLGKIFVSQWGYEQTNVDYYKVVEVSKSGKTFTLQPIGNKVVEVVGYCSCMVVPDDTKLTGQPLTNRRIVNNGSNMIATNVSKNPNYKVYAYLWDGRPTNETSYY